VYFCLLPPPKDAIFSLFGCSVCQQDYSKTCGPICVTCGSTLIKSYLRYCICLLTVGVRVESTHCRLDTLPNDIVNDVGGDGQLNADIDSMSKLFPLDQSTFVHYECLPGQPKYCAVTSQ